MSCKERRYTRGAATAVAAAAAAALSCNFLNDLVKPFEYSTVTLCGTVRDCASGAPVEKAGVVLDGAGECAETDTGGRFTFTNTRTGPRSVIVAKPGYRTDTFSIDLTLEARPETLFIVRENTLPEIDGFTAFPEKLLSIEDTVLYLFEARDATGGIVKAIVETGAAGHQPLEKTWAGAPGSVRDTFRFCYRSPGTFEAKLTVIGTNGDTARSAGVSVTVPDNRSPVFSLVRLSQDGFINGEWGFVEVYARDPDDDFRYLTITWGDTTKPEKSYDSAVAHWHKYSFTNDTQLTITIRLFDSAGASRDTALRADVRTVSPPKLDDKIVYVPSQFLTPDDTAVTIGVRVLAIEGGYVSAILWKLNQDDPGAAQSVRKEYTPETGKIGVVGNVFAQSFSTAKLKETNTVEIIVMDKNGNTSMVIGNFYKAGYRRVPGFLAPGF